MRERKALQVILVFAVAGLLFSGTLSYYELAKEGCAVSPLPISCGSLRIADLPACVYGFLMYLAVFCVTAWGLRKAPEKSKKGTSVG